MSLTPAQRHLIHGLKLFGLDEEETVGIMMAMKTPEQQDELMLWMSENPKATSSDIIGKVMSLIQK